MERRGEERRGEERREEKRREEKRREEKRREEKRREEKRREEKRLTNYFPVCHVIVARCHSVSDLFQMQRTYPWRRTCLHPSSSALTLWAARMRTWGKNCSGNSVCISCQAPDWIANLWICPVMTRHLRLQLHTHAHAHTHTHTHTHTRTRTPAFSLHFQTPSVS